MMPPLFFAGNAVYPIAIMPSWLRAIAHANPLTYEVNALRTLMLHGGSATRVLALDFGVLVGATTLLVGIGSVLCPRVAR